jgi:putative resolvase
MLCSPRQAAEHHGVTTQTLRAWHRTGAIQAEVSSSGHRRYVLDREAVSPAAVRSASDSLHHVIYAMVSSRKQLGDLERQFAALRAFHPGHRVISDVGSGLNFKIPGLLRLLDLAFAGRLGAVVVRQLRCRGAKGASPQRPALSIWIRPCQAHPPPPRSRG